MRQQQSAQEALHLTGVFGEEIISGQRRAIRLFPYKLALFLSDIFVITLSFAVAAAWTEFHLLGGGAVLFLLVPALMIMGSIQSYNLYNYHLIFFKRTHLANLAKSLFWSLISIGILYSIYEGPKVLSEGWLIPSIALIAVGSLYVKRLGNYSLDLIRGLGFGFLGTGIVALLSLNETPMIFSNSWTVPVGLSLAGGALFGVRFFLVQVVYNKWLRRHFRRQVAVVGSDEEARKITGYIIDRDAPFWVAGFVGSNDVDRLDMAVHKSSLGELKDLPRVVQRENIDELIITDETIDKMTLISILDYCTVAGVNVWFPPKLMPIINMKLYIDNFCGLPMIRLCSQKNSLVFNKIKHALDAIATLPAFILQLPILPVYRRGHQDKLRRTRIL